MWLTCKMSMRKMYELRAKSHHTHAIPTATALNPDGTMFLSPDFLTWADRAQDLDREGTHFPAFGFVGLSGRTRPPGDKCEEERKEVLFHVLAGCTKYIPTYTYVERSGWALQ